MPGDRGAGSLESRGGRDFLTLGALHLRLQHEDRRVRHVGLSAPS